MTVVAPTSVNLFGFDAWIDTSAPTADTDVTLTASDGRYTFSKTLRVLVPDPPPVLAERVGQPQQRGRRQLRNRHREVERAAERPDRRSGFHHRWRTGDAALQ